MNGKLKKINPSFREIVETQLNLFIYLKKKSVGPFIDSEFTKLCFWPVKWGADHFLNQKWNKIK